MVPQNAKISRAGDLGIRLIWILASSLLRSLNCSSSTPNRKVSEFQVSECVKRQIPSRFELYNSQFFIGALIDSRPLLMEAALHRTTSATFLEAIYHQKETSFLTRIDSYEQTIYSSCQRFTRYYLEFFFCIDTTESTYQSGAVSCDVLVSVYILQTPDRHATEGYSLAWWPS